jgi:hypothetical protein
MTAVKFRAMSEFSPCVEMMKNPRLFHRFGAVDDQIQRDLRQIAHDHR